MATCVRCGLRFANAMQMGAHTRKCAGTLTHHECNEQEFDGNDAVVGAITTPATVVADANDVVEDAPVVAVSAITTPVPSLQSLARRETKGWGNETLISILNVPPAPVAHLQETFARYACKCRISSEFWCVYTYTCCVYT